MRTSAATHIYDLGQAFIQENHRVSIVRPSNSQNEIVHIANQDGVEIISVKAFRTKDINYLQRTAAEFINPFIMWHRLSQNQHFLKQKFDGIIWYSPTIFWGPLIKQLKQQFCTKSYLILRDIFPDWALDVGLIKSRFVYQILKMIERYQYAQADTIGVQSPNNLTYFKEHNPKVKANLEVLWNWIGDIEETPCSIDLSKTKLANRRIFVYAGNMGVAQGMDSLISLAEAMLQDKSIGFIFVGRGSEVSRLKLMAKQKNLDNTLFFDEIEPSEIPGLCRQCSVGMIALSPKHKTHNIPGKFLTYVKCSLPVFAIGNSGNDLQQLIEGADLGLYVNQVSSKTIMNISNLIAKLDSKIDNRFDKANFFYLNSISSSRDSCIQICKSLSLN